MAESRTKRTKLFHKFVVQSGREMVIDASFNNFNNSASDIDLNSSKPAASATSSFSHVSITVITVDCNNSYTNCDSEESDSSARKSTLLDPSHIADSDSDEVNELQDPITKTTPEMSISENSYLGLQLAEWSLKNNICQSALKSLLNILKPLHPELPSDPRTMLKTERTLEFKCVQPGQYFHFGFQKAVEKLISVRSGQAKQNFVDLCVNVDGLPLTKSSSSQCYPILCKLFGVTSDVQVIGIYHGNDKPNSANNFLEQFIDEAIGIINNGISYNGQHYNVNIKAFICDVPAKSFIKYTRGHSGYNSCTKCTAEGTYINRRICFPETNNLIIRTDSDFRNKIHEEHHTGTSILQNLPGIDMIQSFPNEYMHLVCLGVVKKLIVNLWIDGKPGTKLSFQQVSELSNSLLKCKTEIPSEFNRKTRSLTEARRWKATEFRLFLFYVGPVILHNVLSKDKYINFLTLHVAMTILASEQLVHQIEYANSLLKYFVDTFKTIYGDEYASHNIHNLLHLSDDVKYFGVLDSFSAFPFENHMQAIKHMVRKGDKPLPQICKRVMEQEYIHSQTETYVQTENYVPTIEHSSGPLIDVNIVNKQYKKLQFSNFLLSINHADNCSALTDGTIVVIRNFVSIENKIKIIGNKFEILENYYCIPCESSNLKIYKASGLGPLQYFDQQDIAYKCMKLSISHDEYVIFPLIHVIH